MGIVKQDDERIAKLPLWVQEYITDLKRKIHLTEHMLGELKAEHEVGCTGMVLRSSMDGDVKLPDHDVYRFTLGERRTDAISVNHLVSEKGVIRVSADSGFLIVEPRASNSIHLRVIR